MKRITSRDNPTVKALHALAHSGRERRKQGRTILDGLHLLQAYWPRYGAPGLLAVSEHGLQQAEIAAFLDAHPEGSRIVLPDTLFEHISPVETPTGILALIAIPHPPQLKTITGSCVLLDAIQDAGNLGSILRSVAAAGIGDVLLGEDCAQTWSPRVLRAAMGAHFALRVHEHAALPDALTGYGGRIVATVLHGRTSLYDLDLRGPVAWLFGNEGAGLPQELAELATDSVRIPMPGKAESLNVAAAAAVCLFEEARQKQCRR
jgi:TrmH family RNA methyltransferase